VGRRQSKARGKDAHPVVASRKKKVFCVPVKKEEVGGGCFQRWNQAALFSEKKYYFRLQNPHSHSPFIVYLLFLFFYPYFCLVSAPSKCRVHSQSVFCEAGRVKTFCSKNKLFLFAIFPFFELQSLHYVKKPS
jgi:hypothetical protein